ncbi:uncharacterized membrane protein YuiD isoform X1 [Manihot esculenta]|uniref:uncharacterized membrane protein YuiD isoform X1 n=1 Tax=Manihot esculenta TaxID=3983 RepID=UPI001CC3C28D|nr:uncharacterized membrane protein YuiD isoform X1 [Manihot esculenta]
MDTATDASSQPSIIPSNTPLLSAFLAFALAQFLKLFTTWFKEKRWDSRRILGSGGMPSSHTATVTALAVAIGLQEGTGAPTFAIALVLACVVMYDATGVRLHAGRQAEASSRFTRPHSSPGCCWCCAGVHCSFSHEKFIGDDTANDDIDIFSELWTGSFLQVYLPHRF